MHILNYMGGNTLRGHNYVKSMLAFMTVSMSVLVQELPVVAECSVQHLQTKV